MKTCHLDLLRVRMNARKVKNMSETTPENFVPNPDLRRALFQIYMMQEYLCAKRIWDDYSDWALANAKRLAAENSECADVE
jgi:hypothetical protein